MYSEQVIEDNYEMSRRFTIMYTHIPSVKLFG